MNDTLTIRVVGIDPSLTSTGVAVVVTPAGNGHAAMIDRIAVPGSGLARMRGIRAELRDWLTPAPDLAVIEGPSYGSAGGQVGHHERAGLWWMLVDLIDRHSIPYAVVPPMVRAKYATGRGNASKDAVLASAVRRYAWADVRGNDEADALVLAAMGARWVGFPLEQRLPIACLEALDKVEWPEVCT